MDGDTIALIGMGAVAVVGALLALVGAALFADGLARGAEAFSLAGYALCAIGGGLSAVLGTHHARNPGATTGGLAGVPVSMGSVALVLVATDAERGLAFAGLFAVGLALVGSGVATYAEASER